MKIKKNDNVKVISGKDKGKIGKVIEVYTKNNKLLVEGVSMVKKHKKVEKGDKGAKKGGIETVESPINASNVMFVTDVESRETSRVGYRISDDKKVRFAKKTKKDIK